MLLPASSAAQGRFGVRGGVNLATIESSTDVGEDPFERATGLVAGAFFTVRVLGLELQPEALYVGKGAERQDFGVVSRLKFDYLEFPVLVRLSRRLSDGLRLYGIAGPTFAVRLRAIARFEFDDSAQEESIDDQIEPYDFGLAAGGGIEFGRFLFDARYTHGLTNIDTFASGDEKLANRSLAFTGGIRF